MFQLLCTVILIPILTVQGQDKQRNEDSTVLLGDLLPQRQLRAKPLQPQPKEQRVLQFLKEHVFGTQGAKRDSNTSLADVFDAATGQIRQECKNEPLLELELRQLFATGYDSLSDYQKSEQQRRAALKSARTTLGKNHPATLIAMMRLGQGYQKSGQLVRARELLHDAYIAMIRVLGPEHPDTLTAMSDWIGAIVIWDDSLKPRSSIVSCLRFGNVYLVLSTH